jgi:hypothetical protein
VTADPRIAEVVARTRALVEDGDSSEQIVPQLRLDGFSLIESMAGLAQAGGLTSAEARDAVVDSPTWADARETVEEHRWTEPLNAPGEESLERLRAACSADPRIVEAWFIGRRMARADGSVSERDSMAVVLVEPFQGARGPISEQELSLIAKLRAAAPEAEIGGWLFTTRPVSPNVGAHGVLLYRSSG